MSTNDFAKHAGSKTGYPAKLRAKHLRELRLETVQLELENQEMEQKLMQLRQSMSKEKEERERSNGCHWKSGQAASVSNQNQARFQNKENSGKASSGKFKLKILRDQTPESAKQPVMSKTAKGSACERPKMKGKACGQCEIKNALLVCLECGEDYCTGCYAKFHQKGALKLHRTIPFQAKTQVPIGKLDVAQQFKKDVNPNKSSVKHELKEINKRPFSRNSFSSVIEQSVGTEAVSSPSSRMESRNESGLQLNGAFDEEESAESFKEILIEWRKGDQGHKERKHSLESEPVLSSSVDQNGGVDSTRGTLQFSPLVGEEKLPELGQAAELDVDPESAIKAQTLFKPAEPSSQPSQKIKEPEKELLLAQQQQCSLVASGIASRNKHLKRIYYAVLRANSGVLSLTRNIDILANRTMTLHAEQVNANHTMALSMQYFTELMKRLEFAINKFAFRLLPADTMMNPDLSQTAEYPMTRTKSVPSHGKACTREGCPRSSRAAAAL